jgi:hypothetical protein
VYTYGLDMARSAEDRDVAESLERHGFLPAPSEAGGVMTRPLDVLPEPSPPAGYRLGWVEMREHVIGRVEAQRAAFAPSEMTLAMYERVRVGDHAIDPRHDQGIDPPGDRFSLPPPDRLGPAVSVGHHLLQNGLGTVTAPGR